jgi:hypothetical protein
MASETASRSRVDLFPSNRCPHGRSAVEIVGHGVAGDAIGTLEAARRSSGTSRVVSSSRSLLRAVIG